MKKAIIALVAVTATVIAVRQINRRPSVPDVPYYNYD
jgi:hypothetical protein